MPPKQVSLSVRAIIGLGNPGDKYTNTRHNAGFLFIDCLKERVRIISETKKYNAECIVVEIGAQKVFLLKPQTFMNLSGKSVLQLASFYKINPAELLVAHDEIDLPPGKVRMKQGGGDGGHNGLKDISRTLGSGYHRLRLGVGRPIDRRIDTADYVLGKFSEHERKELDVMSGFLTEHPEHLLHPDRYTKLLSAYATFRDPPKPKKPVTPPSEPI